MDENVCGEIRLVGDGANGLVTIMVHMRIWRNHYVWQKNFKK